MAREPIRPVDTSSSREMTLQISHLMDDFSLLNGQVQQIQQILQQQPPPIYQTVPQAVNIIDNGTFSHSSGSWANSATADNRRYECHGWYSHPVRDGQAMFLNTTVTGAASVTFTNTDVNTGTDEITIANHNLETGLAVLFNSTSAPAPLVDGTIYYVIRISSTVIQLATTAANAIAGTPINLTSTGGAVTDLLSFNYTLKEDSHTLYSSNFSDWAWDIGSARLQGNKSLDAIIPNNNVEPGYTFYGVFDIVRRNAYITVDGDERIWAGLYAKQDGAWDWVNGDFELEATVLGSPATTTSRDYTIHVTTDRGFTVQSQTLTVANAPSDAAFAAGARVLIEWKNVLRFGVQAYELYRDTGGTVQLMQRVDTGQTSTLDNNGFISTTAGLPSTTFDRLVAYTATIPNILENLPYAGDPLNPQWVTLPFALKVPQNYNMGLTDLTVKTWLRYGLSSKTRNIDLSLPGTMTTATDATVTNALGLFTADQVGLTVTITYSTGNVQDTTIASYTSATEIELTDVADETDTDATIYITDGAPAHSLWIDLAHLTYVQGAAFSPSANDSNGTHGIPPVVPNGTTQGGSGGGQPPGGIDGQPTCLDEDELVDTNHGLMLASELYDRFMAKEVFVLNGNRVKWMTRGMDDVYILETERGVVLRATATKQIYYEKSKKRTLAKLIKGSKILTKVDGIEASDTITNKLRLGRRVVIQIGLEPHDQFYAGSGSGTVCVSNSKPILIGVEI